MKSTVYCSGTPAFSVLCPTRFATTAGLAQLLENNLYSAYVSYFQMLMDSLKTQNFMSDNITKTESQGIGENIALCQETYG